MYLTQLSFKCFLNFNFIIRRATVSEEEIKEAFTKNGFTVKAFKFFPKDRKMALIQMPSMDDAVTALIVSLKK